MPKTYYPDQRFVSDMATILRDCVLPEEAIGSVQVSEGQHVDIRDIVARGLIPDRHLIIDAVAALGAVAKDDERLRDLLLVNLRQPVTPDEPIAGKSRDRGRRVFSPINGIVVYVGDGRIIMQEMPNFINLQAGVRGDVVQVYENRGVSIEATGGIVQGVWGNGGNVIATMRMEPRTGGIKSLSVDDLETTYRNEIVVTTQPIDNDVLDIADARTFAGIVAPSMNADLIERVVASERVIMLTEGFGQIRMSEGVQSVLQEFGGYQAVLDAVMPRRFIANQPEVVINRPTDEEPPEPNFRLALRKGMRVRITRAPHAGEVGRVVAIPDQPVLLDNGIRAPCASVELVMGDPVYIPLANLELAGR